MTKFHPLCEALADVLAKGMRADRSGEEIAQDMIDAINASGIAWVAPWKFSDGTSWENTRNAATYDSDELWEMWRDAYLAQ